MADLCGVLGRLCGSQGESIVCYLCLDEIHHSVWNTGEHRKQCASRNTSQLTSYSVHPSLKCSKCSAKLKLWPAQGPGFSCDSGLESCPGKSKLIPSSGDNRYNCFLCDYDLCVSCTRELADRQTDNAQTSKQNGHQTKPSRPTVLVEDENQNNMVNTDNLDDDDTTSKRTSILNDDDNIPLIDVQSSTEDIPELISISARRPKSASVNQRPTMIEGRSRSIASLGINGPELGGGLLTTAKKRVADSPDIFNLRAPLVSCENFLTPATSREGLNHLPAD